MKFKVGDKVKIIHQGNTNDGLCRNWIGKEGEVMDIMPRPGKYRVIGSMLDFEWIFHEYQLAPADDKPKTKFKLGDKVRIISTDKIYDGTPALVSDSEIVGKMGIIDKMLGRHYMVSGGMFSKRYRWKLRGDQLELIPNFVRGDIVEIVSCYSKEGMYNYLIGKRYKILRKAGTSTMDRGVFYRLDGENRGWAFFEGDLKLIEKSTEVERVLDRVIENCVKNYRLHLYGSRDARCPICGRQVSNDEEDQGQPWYDKEPKFDIGDVLMLEDVNDHRLEAFEVTEITRNESGFMYYGNDSLDGLPIEKPIREDELVVVDLDGERPGTKSDIKEERQMFNICKYIEEISTGLSPTQKVMKRKKVKAQLAENQDKINETINSEFWEDGTLPTKKRVLEINKKIEAEKED